MAIELEYIVNNEESFKKFKEAVGRGVNILESIDNLKADLKSIAEDMKEDLDIATKDFNAVVKHTHKRGLDDEIEHLDFLKNIIDKIDNG